MKIRLHEDAARQFAEMTAKQVGKPMEFRLRGRSVMAPIIAEPVISGTLDLVGLADGDRTDVLDEVRAPC